MPTVPCEAGEKVLLLEVVGWTGLCSLHLWHEFISVFFSFFVTGPIFCVFLLFVFC